MKWIFFFLVGINVLLLGFAVTGGNGGSASVSTKESFQGFDFTGIDQIELNKKGANTSIATSSVVTSGAATGSSADSFAPIRTKDGRDLCEMVGPFSDTQVAQDFYSRLDAIEISAKVHDIQLPTGYRYWVILPPLDNRKKAIQRLQEVQSQGIDSYLIPKGELENGVSLGVFSEEEKAQEVLEGVKEKGLDNARIDVQSHKSSELWVILGAGEAEKMSQITWDRVLEGMDRVTRRRNLCLDVASVIKIQ